MSQDHVLVIGAGPSGMVAAAELTRRGVRTIIVDKRPGPTERSKATILWPRAIDVLAEIDGVDQIRKTCLAQSSLRYYDGGTSVAELSLPENLRPAVAPQNIVEAQLHAKLENLGTEVKWMTLAENLTHGADEVSYTLRNVASGATEAGTASYVVAADGAWSTSRSAVGAKFTGATHEMTFVVSDAELGGADLHERSTYYWCSPRGIVVMTRLAEGVWRIFTTLPPGIAENDITVDLVQKLLEQRVPLALHVGEPRWISPFKVHARQIDSMRHGRFLFVGDAAHIHSPAGGQGVNLGILDAHNLAWKLALVVQGASPVALLDTFADERGKAAVAAIRQANLQTKLWMIQSSLGRRLRNRALRLVSSSRLYRQWYAPWLCGYRTMYSKLAKTPTSVAAILTPGKKHLLGENVGYLTSETGTEIRRQWTSPDSFVVLRRSGTRMMPGELEDKIPYLIREVAGNEWSRLAGRDRSARRADFILVAPDGYIWSSGNMATVLRELSRHLNLQVASGQPDAAASTTIIRRRSADAL
ncbi:FAD-dependent monooxygenase [Rhodococcoides yunnanense]|mgnify:CR=1 FL=1|jgi:2-polyprenyl-6-methoxyphenol hydroxylase-like FAD-dependent oxidoreductase|uniref:FAD-dependent monooxygenase n=1 Tax=Rhodococcoides yunnanense TaxID=278209 RepID=UPI0022B0A6F6|nr:FAD-dependent monooxygenase [Rhodococcus yunnanensis]MCZ4278965.1 FAD-dependent monooxygenase [Rhodococcus yunnanensis]